VRFREQETLAPIDRLRRHYAPINPQLFSPAFLRRHRLKDAEGDIGTTRVRYTTEGHQEQGSESESSDSDSEETPAVQPPAPLGGPAPAPPGGPAAAPGYGQGAPTPAAGSGNVAQPAILQPATGSTGTGRPIEPSEPRGLGKGGWWPNSHQLWQLARDAATLSHVAINLRGRLCQMRRHHARRSAEVRRARDKTRLRQGAADPLEEPLSMLFGED